MSSDRFRRVALVAAIFIALSVGVSALIANEDVQPARKPQSNFVRLLSLVPDTPETRFDVFMVDYDRLFSSLGVKRAGSMQSSAEDQQLQESLDASWRLHGSFGLAFGYAGKLGMLSDLGAYSRADPTSDALGYGLADIDGYVYGGRDPGGFEAVAGRFSRDLVVNRISRCSDCGLEAVETNYEGRDYYAWGADFQHNLRKRLVPPLDEMGSGGRLAAQPSYVMRTAWSGGMEAMLDAAAGRRPSLADDPDIVLMAKALDSMSAVSAYVSYCTWPWSRVSEYAGGADGGCDRSIDEGFRRRPDRKSPRDLTKQFGLYRENSPPENLLRPYQAFSVASGNPRQPTFCGTAAAAKHSRTG